jgi:hypothetical protein
LASFYAYDFIFDGIPSQNFDLKIISFDDGGLFDSMGSGDVNIITQGVLRRSKPYYLGRTQEPALSFDLIFGRKNTISGYDNDAISKWLFGRSSYKQLYILQDDLDGAYFNCFLTKPKKLSIGNMQYAFECTVVCDSPFAYRYPKTVSGSYVSKANETFNVYNNSSEDYYLYPELSFKISTSGSAFSLSNANDNNRSFEFGLNSEGGLSGGEEITVNNDLQIIQSSTGLRRLKKFNKNWLRLLPELNQITIAADIDWFQIVYNERMKVGG